MIIIRFIEYFDYYPTNRIFRILSNYSNISIIFLAKLLKNKTSKCLENQLFSTLCRLLTDLLKNNYCLLNCLHLLQKKRVELMRTDFSIYPQLLCISSEWHTGTNSKYLFINSKVNNLQFSGSKSLLIGNVAFSWNW